jgi:hypothetical protein
MDWAIGKCGKGKKDYDHFAHYPRYEKKVHRRSKESVPDKKKPLIINFIGIDSFSRGHFYRKLEKTVDYLN